MPTPMALDGIRVADFSWVGAGPFLTKPLADHGADVVKVESRRRVDPIRSMAPFRDGVAGVERSGYFANRNTSKRSICLDLKDPRGRELALRLIEASDVVVNNFSPGTMDRLGLGYDDARAVRPDVVYLEMPMMGTEGPHRDCRGYGLTIAAAGGLLGLSGYDDRAPVGTGTNYPDHVPNPLHAAVAVLAALRKRRRTGQGEYIELAQLESTINAIGPAVVAAAHGETVRPAGNDDVVAVPHGVYPCAGEDRWCAVAVFDDEQWAATRLVLSAVDWTRYPQFDTVDGRRRARADLDRTIGQASIRWDADRLAAELTARGVAASPVQHADDLIRRDPQLRARAHWVTLDHPVMGPSIYDRIPYRLSVTPGYLRTPAPLLGADTRDVCTQLLGLTDNTYEVLEQQGVVG
ncbi:CaiB/BaiF CoA transferase family protein [Mycolicibacterium goodii]|uniref:CaiB/BaiF CoA transferase family protein n=1 Tax=Mycolicibacterium goodii TaxID=134601 RepID=UPI000C26BFBB|nr:CoA transferase [Mycolicibacterium goodii]PJK19608.1 carnitine dehydratase [Mycolicibacterium goodii]